MKNISIVFPLYNEEKRIKKLFIGLKNFIKKRNNKSFELIFVDDGSSDQTIKKIKEFLKNNKKTGYKYQLIRSKRNFGKGHALKLGINSASYNWIFTMDADLAVEMKQITKWLAKYQFKDDYAYFGSRNLPESNKEYKYYRRIIGEIWQTLVFLFVDRKIKDTQCGFKFYNKKYAKKVFGLLKEYGFAHDMELIFLLKKQRIKIQELPVDWKHVDGSKLNPFIEPIKFFFKFLFMLIKYRM